MPKSRFLSILLTAAILACGTLVYGYQAERTPEYALQEIMTGVENATSHGWKNTWTWTGF